MQLQGARHNRDTSEGIGIISTLRATTAEGKPAIGGSVAFTGVTLFYSFYAEAGLKEASSSSDENQDNTRGGTNGFSSIPTSSETSISGADGKVSNKIPIFKYNEWPKYNENNDNVAVIEVDKFKF